MPDPETPPTSAPTTESLPLLRPIRRRLADTRPSITHKFNVAGHEGYLSVGLYEDGRPGELYITMNKEGSTIGGLMDSLGIAVSVALQYGVPVESLVNKFSSTRFSPSGMTGNSEIPFAKSLVDYIFRWMGMQFIPGYRDAHLPRPKGQELEIPQADEVELPPNTVRIPADTPTPVVSTVGLPGAVPAVSSVPAQSLPRYIIERPILEKGDNTANQVGGFRMKFEIADSASYAGLSDEERSRMTLQLGRILGVVEQSGIVSRLEEAAKEVMKGYGIDCVISIAKIER